MNAHAINLDRGTRKRLSMLLLFMSLIMIVNIGCSSGSKSSRNDALATSVSGAGPNASKADYKESAVPPDTTAADSLSQGEGYSEAGQNEIRKLIYTANLDIQVADYATSSEQIRQYVDQMGGYILTFNEYRSEQAPSGEWEVRIPAARFHAFIEQLDEFPALRYSKNIQGEDVTEQYVDLTSRLKAKQTAEERLIGFMETATDSAALLSFSNQLAEVQVEVEQLKGRLRYLDNHVDYSTVHINLYQRHDGLNVQQAGYSFTERIERAFIGSAQFVWRGIQGIAVFVVGAIPIILPLAVVVVPLFVYWRRRRNR